MAKVRAAVQVSSVVAAAVAVATTAMAAQVLSPAGVSVSVRDTQVATDIRVLVATPEYASRARAMATVTGVLDDSFDLSDEIMFDLTSVLFDIATATSDVAIVEFEKVLEDAVVLDDVIAFDMGAVVADETALSDAFAYLNPLSDVPALYDTAGFVFYPDAARLNQGLVNEFVLNDTTGTQGTGGLEYTIRTDGDYTLAGYVANGDQLN